MGFGRKGFLPSPTPESVEATVQAAVATAQRRWTARALEREIAARASCPRTVVRTAIRRLVDGGILEYDYTFGQSYLVLSFRRPVAVGERFVILSPGCQNLVPADRLPLCLAPGSAFGSGRHPTTRLALRGLEKAWSLAWSSAATGSAPPKVIDLGTGSGILAIAAARLGAVAVTAVDIDACARWEATANIALNATTASISVRGDDLENLPGTFDMVIANLRLPTLIQLLPWVRSHLPQKGCVVISGIREDEWTVLKARYEDAGCHPVWHRCEAGWIGGLFRVTVGGQAWSRFVDGKKGSKGAKAIQ